MDYKEYSKLRSIARKRIERLAAAGKMDYVRIPTVKEIKASKNPEHYLNVVQSFLGQDMTVRRAKKANISKVSPVSFAEKKATLPKPKPALTPQQELAKQARRREQKRRSKAKRAVEKAAKNPAQAKRYASFLKAYEKVGKDMRALGIDLGQWVGVLSPKKAVAFAEYLDYRFSQGDFKEQYVIDIFIRDFATMQKKGHSLSDLQKDFDAFLADRKKLEANEEEASKYGATSGEMIGLWKQFVNR